MCRGKKYCAELDKNWQEWDADCPLRRYSWFDQELDLFLEAVEVFINGDQDACLSILSGIKSTELQMWSVEHGQMAGMHRANHLNMAKPIPVPVDSRDPLRSPRRYEAAVFQRDGWRCRYCTGRLVSNTFFSLFIKVLDHECFRKGPTNMDTHGIIHIFNPVADHVVPWNLGGMTNEENLVSSCGPCNYGKAGYTVEQMGIGDPRDRPPIRDDWDGLLSRVPALKLML